MNDGWMDILIPRTTKLLKIGRLGKVAYTWQVHSSVGRDKKMLSSRPAWDIVIDLFSKTQATNHTFKQPSKQTKYYWGKERRVIFKENLIADIIY